MTSSDPSSDDARVIEAGAPPTRYARGWHCLGLADDFRDGEPHAIQAFGTKLVVFADSSGALNVINGYCPHMGGDLSMGTIKGDEVACPFHDWRWGGDGRCRSIPYARRVPPRARTKTWLTLEENGQLFVYHDPQGNPPPPEVRIPRIEEVFSEDWTGWHWSSIVIEGSHCREIVDNVVDMAHFFYVHFAFPVYFKNVFEGHLATQYMNSKGRPDISLGTSYTSEEGEEQISTSEATYFGPSYMIDWLGGSNGIISNRTILINCHYPISPTSFKLQWGVMVERVSGRPQEEADAIAAATARGVGIGFEQDVEIWQNKTRIDNPLLCEEDGPVYQLRRWYEQFYVDVEDMTPEMVQRFEFELDTQRAIEFWQREVSENLARNGGKPAVPA